MGREKFQNRRLTGTIRVVNKFEDGTEIIWEADKSEVVNHIIDILEEYHQQGYTLTLRQLHYQMVTNNWIVNHTTSYKKLGDVLDDCRYSGVVDWYAIEDRGRVPILPYSVTGITGALEDTIIQYRLDRQRGQMNHVEVWTEKDALSGILRTVTEEYHVNLVVNKGYSSSSAMYQAYQRILDRWVSNSEPTTILYLGDHDPSGLDMVRDITERLGFMLKNGRYGADPGECLHIIPMGLTMAQVKKYKLPPNPTKLTDSRAEGYIKQFGKTCWEVDALKPDVLTGLVKQFIERNIDMGTYKDILELENQQIEELRAFITTKEN